MQEGVIDWKPLFDWAARFLERHTRNLCFLYATIGFRRKCKTKRVMREQINGEPFEPKPGVGKLFL